MFRYYGPWYPRWRYHRHHRRIGLGRQLLWGLLFGPWLFRKAMRHWGGYGWRGGYGGYGGYGGPRGGWYGGPRGGYGGYGGYGHHGHHHGYHDADYF